MNAQLRPVIERHARFTAALRSFFDEREYLPVETPTLAPFLIPEPSIEVFESVYRPGTGEPRPLWLIPSPELWMKRLLAAGSGNIYQVSRSFRNGDYGGPHHNPEFSLLEWYTLDADYRDSLSVTESLFERLLPLSSSPEAARRLSPPFTRLTMQEAFERWAGIDLARCQDPQRLREAATRQGVAIAEPSTWEEAFHIVFLTLVEPALPRDRPVVLMDYPSLIPTTARTIAGTPWSERWELYVDGVEIANCYTELTDAAALSRLIQEEIGRKKGSRVVPDPDVELATIFPPGFPRCSGVALGVDRLEMVLHGENSLEGVILFPFSAILRRHSGTQV